MAEKECCGSKGPRHKKDCPGEVRKQEVAEALEEAFEEAKEEAKEESVASTKVDFGDKAVELDGDKCTVFRKVFVGGVQRLEEVRTYSKEVHGDDFAKLAEQFARK